MTNTPTKTCTISGNDTDEYDYCCHDYHYLYRHYHHEYRHYGYYYHHHSDDYDYHRYGTFAVMLASIVPKPSASMAATCLVHKHERANIFSTFNVASTTTTTTTAATATTQTAPGQLVGAITRTGTGDYLRRDTSHPPRALHPFNKSKP